MFVLLVTGFLFMTLCQAQGQQKPNVIFILADDLGWNDVGFHGSNQIPTPNIDALAYAGVILNEHYLAPLCSPSRSAIMTGRHPIHTGMWHFYVSSVEPWGLGLEEKLLPEYLKENGYVTHIVGKWHLGFFRSEYTPTYRGFDSHFGYWTGQLDYWNHSHQQLEGYMGLDVRRDLDSVWNTEGEYFTRLLTREAIKVVEEHDLSQPLFLYVPHLATHSGNGYDTLQAPQETIDKFAHIEDYDRRVFAAMASELDTSVGELVNALGGRGMLENSIIVFSSDNGGAAGGFNLNWASNWPLRGTKDTVWEGGCKGSSVIWSPLITNPPRVSTQKMHLTDWLPTIMEAIGDPFDGPDPVASPPPFPLDGVSLWQALAVDPNLEGREEVLINIDPLREFAAIRKREWKLMIGTTFSGDFDEIFEPSGREGQYDIAGIQISPAARALSATSRPVPTNDVILSLRGEAILPTCINYGQSTCNPLTLEPCLFNLATDPCENINLASSQPEVLAELMADLEAYAATMVPARNLPLDPQSNPSFWNDTWVSWYDFTHPLTTTPQQ